jgi:hypothetical protein
MEGMVIIIGIITLIFIWLNLLVSIRIMGFLKSKGETASLFNNNFFVKGKIFKYLPIYKKITLEIEGKVGFLYFFFFMTLFFFLTFLFTGIIIVV